MTVEEAAKSLAATLSTKPWLVSIGAGRTARGETIYLYVTHRAPTSFDWLRNGWCGFPVEVVVSGRMRMADG